MAGRVHPNATILTLKSTYPILNGFREGLCVVNDGSSVGLIDDTDAFIIPFGKYSSIQDFEKGFLIAQDAKTSQPVVLDNCGNIVLPGVGSLSEVTDSGIEDRSLDCSSFDARD